MKVPLRVSAILVRQLGGGLHCKTLQQGGALFIHQVKNRFGSGLAALHGLQVA